MKKIVVLILLFVCKTSLAQVKARDTIIFKFDAKHPLMNKHTFFDPLVVIQTQDSASINYSYNKPIKKRRNSFKTTQKFFFSHFVQSNREVEKLGKNIKPMLVLRKKERFLKNKKVIGINFFLRKKEKKIFNYLFKNRKKAIFLLYDETETKNNEILLREVWFTDENI